MNIAPILAADLPIKIHLATIAISVMSSVFIFASAKGTAAHKFAGRIGAMALMITAIASFGINSFNSPFFGLSPIHLFSVLVIVSVPYGIVQVRRGNIRAHERTMRGVAVSGLGLAGAFTLIPGRMMAEVLFG